MKLEDQVVNLELSIKLHDLGVKRRSYFVWHCYNSEGFDADGSPLGKEVFDVTESWQIDEPLASAFTVAELGEMLPSAIDSFYWIDMRNWYDFEICYQDDNYNIKHVVNDKSEANARAKMLIWLIENGHVKVGE